MKKKTLEKLLIISFYFFLTLSAYRFTADIDDGVFQNIIHLMFCASAVGCWVFGVFWFIKFVLSKMR